MLFFSPKSGAPNKSNHSDIMKMQTSVVKATNKDESISPKQKHVECKGLFLDQVVTHFPTNGTDLINYTWAPDSSIHELFEAIGQRFSETNWIVSSMDEEGWWEVIDK